jgi:hypothetical protein
VCPARLLLLQHIEAFGHVQLQETFALREQTLEIKLKPWCQDCQQLCIQQPVLNTDVGFRSTLLMIYHAIYILAAVSLRRQETTFDQYLDASSEIVRPDEEAKASRLCPDPRGHHG